MATPAYIAIFFQNKPLPGSVSLHDHEGEEGKKSCTPVLELDHRVWTVKDCWDCCIHFYSRAHDDFNVTIPLNSMAPRLHHFLCRQIFLPKVELYLYKFNKKQRKEMEYFRVTMKHVLTSRLNLFSPNIKTPGFERYGPMLKIGFRYQRITWLYTKGYLIHTDEWDQAFDPGDMRDFSKTEESLYEAPVQLPPLKINPRVLKITEPEQGLEVGEPFETRLDSLLSRVPSDKNERLVWLSLWSKYKGKAREMHLAEDAKVDDLGNAVVRSSSLPENPDWKADPDKSQSEPVEYWWRAESKHMDGFFEGEKIKWPKPEKKPVIPFLCDCHIHVNNGHCAPLPLSRKRVPVPFVNRYLSQDVLDTIGIVTMGKFGELQKEPIGSIAASALKESLETLVSKNFAFMGETGKRRRIMAVLPMNMDYAHYRGYEGRMIYENKDGKTVYWDEGKKEYHGIKFEDVKKWIDYTTQLTETANSFYLSKGLLLPFYHYDPRAHLKDWQGPFRKNLVQTAPLSSFPDNMPAAGIKMYTALGYRPMDPDLKFPWDAYYGHLANNKIPVLCHGSRGGMTTHDIIHYYDNAHAGASNDVPPNFKTSWFLNAFMSPAAWSDVLEKHPDLYLCLAHFGGGSFWGGKDTLHSALSEAYWQDLDNLDRNNWIAWFLHLMKTYPNFYVDLAYVVSTQMRADFFKKALTYDPRIKTRILFGSDWWMHTLESGYGGNSYMKYMETFVDLVLSLDDKNFLEKAEVKCPEELLAYFMVLNPMRFLRLKDVAPMMSKAFSTHPDIIEDSTIYEPDQWIESVPETIEDFYK